MNTSPYATGEAIRPPVDGDDRVYPCINCGKLRSSREGGTTFTICDDCWDAPKETQ